MEVVAGEVWYSRVYGSWCVAGTVISRITSWLSAVTSSGRLVITGGWGVGGGMVILSREVSLRRYS